VALSRSFSHYCAIEKEQAVVMKTTILTAKKLKFSIAVMVKALISNLSLKIDLRTII
jgi:hypothetical protein